jgi:hypothetical protein
LYHLGLNVIIWDETLSSGTNVIIWYYCTCYHLGLHVIIWDAMLSSGANVIIWDTMLSSGANVIIVSSGAYVIIWCYHVMLSSGMITHPFFIFPENFTHSFSTPSDITLLFGVWIQRLLSKMALLF